MLFTSFLAFIFPFLILLLPSTLISLSGNLSAGPQVALLRVVYFTLSLLHILPFPLLAGLVYPPLSCWLPCYHLVLTLFPIGVAKVLPWLFGSSDSNWFLTLRLLTALMEEAANTSGTPVNNKHLPDNMAIQSRRQPSWFLPLWECQMLLTIFNLQMVPEVNICISKCVNLSASEGLPCIISAVITKLTCIKNLAWSSIYSV
jgi:hypothetical protein